MRDRVACESCGRPACCFQAFRRGGELTSVHASCVDHSYKGPTKGATLSTEAVSREQYLVLMVALS